ncbi:MAG TPA: UDP-N-acetylmuramoyl-L-alanine--D-glutamate ligase [Pirellulales bacterium]|nr:UDP-N-acetylmuramoyl-L-alanine--D-glutamate ligase [Pirellulales bacterium]
MGLGCHGGGVASARYCAQAGAIVTVTDLADDAELTNSLKSLCDVPIARFTLGKHIEADFCDADIVVVNPAVKPGDLLVNLARHSHAQITSEAELFLNACPAKVIGVTGTVGKSTTAAMLATILNKAQMRTWLGGNIGNSLLIDLPNIRPDDTVVLEMSSFQLHWLSETARWPEAAIVTNCSRNHLDWHGTWRNYVSAKQRLLSNLPKEGFAVLNHDDQELASWQSMCRALVLQPQSLETLPPLKVTGLHNLHNAACTAAAAVHLGAKNRQHVFCGLTCFLGLPYRLKFVGEVKQRRFYNDSKSTNPAATMAALHTMNGPTWLLIGGADRPSDFTELIGQMIQQTRGVAVFGGISHKLQETIRKCVSNFSCFRADTLSKAFYWCWKNSQAGHSILLSPGCPSTDQYHDFAERGEDFDRLVHSLDNQ